MQAIASLVQDDPYLRMPKEERLALHRRRRARLRSFSPPTPRAPIIFIEIPNTPLGVPKIAAPVKRSSPVFRLWCDDIVACGLAALKAPSFAAILEATAFHFGVLAADLMKGARTKILVIARHVAAFIVSRLTSASLPEIGRRFGGMDHTSILYAVRKISNRRKTDPIIADAIAAIGSRFPAFSACLA